MITSSFFSEWFDWEVHKEYIPNLYPFDIKVVAALFEPQLFPFYMHLGQNSIEWMFNIGTIWNRFGIPRQVLHGVYDFYFPERWLDINRTRCFMQTLMDVHKNYPIKKVQLVTGSPVILSDFSEHYIRTVKIIKEI